MRTSRGAATPDLRLGLEPGGRIVGELAPAGSKSQAQRALVAAGLAAGSTRITNLPGGDDVRAATRLIEACGASVRKLAPAALEVVGRPPGPERGWSAVHGVDAGESGTLARLATAALGLCGRAGVEHELRVSGSLARRASAPLFAALERADVRVTRPDGAPVDGWPVRLRALGPPPDVVLEHPVSSQEASALLIALAAWPGASALSVTGPIPSRPYVALTLAVLAEFGATIEAGGAPEAERFTIRGPLTAPPVPVQLEPDASSAAVALAAACLSGGELRVPRLCAISLQGDVRIVEHLARFGCAASAENGALVASGEPRHGAELDLASEPDLAPVLAAVAAAVAHRHGASSLLTGLDTLPGKESSRIAVLAEGLRAIGLDARDGGDRLAIRPGVSLPRADVTLDPHGDHRMAFAFALLGLVVPGVRVLDPGCVAKSWPGFWDDLASLGARVAEAG